jgi:hypothetical protein
MSFQDLFGGFTEKVTPSENGSFVSFKSREASPPDVMDLNIVLSFPFIVSNPIRNSYFLFSFNSSCFSFIIVSFYSSFPTTSLYNV